MNKGITSLIMLVILGAMGLVFFFHVSAEEDGAAARKNDVPAAASTRKPNAVATPLTDLIRIDPPMSSLDLPAEPRPAGSPVTVRVPAGASPASADARTRPLAREGETSAGATARQEPPTQQPQTQQMQAQQMPIQQAQVRQTQTEDASGGRTAGRQTYPPSLTPWTAPPASGSAARTTSSQGTYVAPVYPEPAEQQRPVPGASGPAPTRDTPPELSASAPAAPQSRTGTSPVTQPVASAPAAQRRETAAEMPQRPDPPEAPPAVAAPTRARAGVPESTTEKTRPPQPASASAAQSPEKSYKSAHTLTNISLTFVGNDMRLLLEADNAFPCKTFALSGPDRLVIDLPGAWKGMKAPTVPGNRIVRKARVGLQSNSARIVLDLSSPLKNHKVEQRGNVVEILVQ
jgi:hypothetical protein